MNQNLPDDSRLVGFSSLARHSFIDYSALFPLYQPHLRDLNISPVMPATG